jgi:diguanylate cyclase (GGDEF)-like protein
MVRDDQLRRGKGTERFRRLRRSLRRALTTPRISTGNQASVRRYAESLSFNVPVIYGMLLLCMVMLATRFHGTAPAWLTVVAPVLLCSFGAWRLLRWLPSGVRARSDAELVRDVKFIARSGAIAGAVSVCWALLLYGYGDDHQRALVQLVVTIGCLTAILGMPHAPQTALRMGLVVILPAALFFMTSGQADAPYVAMIELMMFALVVHVTFGHHRDFVKLDISRRKLARREAHAARLADENLAHAMYDPLTGALNRRAILAQLDQLAGNRSKPLPWLALIDLDGFKLINDTYGHAAGDEVLRAISGRISECDHLLAHGRLGGDEFAAVLDGALDCEAAVSAMEALSASIRQPIVDRGAVLRLSACVGLRHTDGLSVGECVERADAALYKAKAKGDGTVAVFEAEDEIALQQKRRTTRSFNECDLDNRLRLLFQPMFDADQGRVVRFEALARWSPDGKTWLSADRFMPLAEATGRTDDLTSQVLTKALRECRAWEFDCSLAINLCPRDVLRESAVERLEAIAQAAGAPNEAIVFEVTERGLLTDPALAARQLERFRNRGFRIALDDFGAGWSSLSHVQKLPLDCLKIDRALTGALASDPGARAIAGTIAALAWQLGIECVAEGVETAGQAETARALGIRLMQGYHFGHPLPIAEALGAMRGGLQAVASGGSA